MGLFDSIGSALTGGLTGFLTTGSPWGAAAGAGLGLLSGGDDTFSPGGSTTTLNRQSNWTPEQEALFTQLLKQTSAGLNADGVTPYPGKMYAEQNPLEAAYFSNVMGTPEDQEARSKAIRQILSGQPLDTSEYYQSSFYEPAMREYQTSILPQVMESASGAGFHSSDTLNSMYKSGADLETALAAKRAELIYNAQQAAQGRQATFAGSPTNIQTGYTSDLGTAGSYARQIENEKLQTDLARWLSGESVGGKTGPTTYNPNTQLALSLLGLSPYSYGQNVDTTGAGLGYGMLQGASSGLGSILGTKALTTDYGDVLGKAINSLTGYKW